jgi:8-oxo-dGTP pyrophosphatase MutT (NUDIX family)
VSLDTLTAREIAQRLATAANGMAAPDEPLYDEDRAPQPAAVLLPMFRRAGQWHLLYIRRAENLADRHSGEVAFPGGRIEDQDPHPAGAALREAEEEIGLATHHVEILGQLPSFLTSSNYLVTPVVGQIPWPLVLQPDPAEVARVFSMPLHWLANPGHHELRPWRPRGHRRPRPVIFFDEHDGERLWGVSARITLSLLQVLWESG